MSTDVAGNGGTRDVGISLGGLRFAVFSTRNLVFLIAVLAMNFTLMRPSPVDLLFIASFLITLVFMTLFQTLEVTRRALFLALLLACWALSFFIASMPHLGEEFVAFELIAKTFAISIGIIGAFVSMTWTRRNFETFMKVYIVSCVIASILGTIGFLTQMELLTWDGRAKGLIDDPNMYGSFLIPAAVFCAYFLSRGQGSKVLLSGALAIVMLGILLSFSRIAVVAGLGCFFAYIFFHNRRRPRRLFMIVGGLVATGLVLFVFASLTSAEFTAKLLDRLTFAKSYDLGEEGRYARYMLVVPMILQNPIGVGVLQLEKIFPEPIHNIWLSSFVNYGWGGGISYVTLAVGSIIVSLRNYRRTKNEITIALLIALVGIVFCSTLHEGEHWRHTWLFYGLVWGLNPFNAGMGATPSAAGQGLAGQRPPPRRVSVTPAVRPRMDARAPAPEPQPLLHRALVDPAPSFHSADDPGVTRLQEREPLLSAAGTIDSSFPTGSPGLGLAAIRVRAKRLLDVMVGIWIFTGGLVLFEPSPYELTFVAVLPLAFIAGTGLYRSTLGLLVLLIAFIPFALIACFQVRITPVSEALIFSTVTIFLLLTAYFLANYVAEATERRMRIIMGAYTAAAVACAIIGTLAYLGLMPGADMFLRYGRAKATFNDPNVYGPFLVLPAMFALQRILLGSGRTQFWSAVVYMILFVGVFVSFSRAAWGHFALSSLVVLVLCFWLEAAARDKVRIMIMALLGAGMLVVSIAGLLSIPAVSAMFEVRAAGQNYDSGETGRFGRQGYAFELALNNPLGIGPYEFNNLRIKEDPHNVYASVLHVYGWGGGAMYYLLVILTLWRGTAALTRPSPYRLMMIPLMATFIMLVGESAIIDSDHWRHYYLVAGLIWGVASAINNDDRRGIGRSQMLI